MRRFSVALFALLLTGALTRGAAAAEPFNWTGFYIGMNAGWSWGKEDTLVISPGPAFSKSSIRSVVAYEESTNPDGAIGGVQAGYNWQVMPNWILGIEADIQASGENASGNPHQSSIRIAENVVLSQVVSHNDALLWFGTVRGRLGYVIWPSVMLYGTGGLAYGRLNDSASASSTLNLRGIGSQTFDASVTRTGWTAGGGIEGSVPDSRVTWKAEYLYVRLDTADYTFNDPVFGIVRVSSKFTDNIFRVGFNWHLN